MNAINSLMEIGAIRTLTRQEYRELARHDRLNPDLTETPPNDRYKALVALREQVAVEIAPRIERWQAAHLSLFRGANDRTIRKPAEYVTSKVTPPQITEDLTNLSDKEGPKQKAAIRRLESIPANLRERLDNQLRPRLPYLQSLKET